MNDTRDRELGHLETILWRCARADARDRVIRGPTNPVFFKDCAEAICEYRGWRNGPQARSAEVAGYVAGLRALNTRNRSSA